MAARKAPASYTKIVIKGMTKAEMTLKVVMSPHEPVKQFVEQYVKLVPDSESSEFQKMLEIKGLRKIEQTQYLELFKALSPAPTSASSPSKAAASEATPSISGTSSPLPTSSEESRIKKLERLIKQGFER